MQLKDKNLIIVSHKLHLVDRHKPNKVYTDGGFPVITNEIARYFKSVTLAVPVEETDTLRESINYSENIAIEPIPLVTDKAKFYLISQLKTLNAIIRKGDIVYAMGPYDIGVLGLFLARILGKPVFGSIDTDRAYRHYCQLFITESEKFKSLNKKIIKYINFLVIKHGTYNLLRLLGNNSPMFITGDMFLGNRPKWHQWVKTTFASHEIPTLKIGKETNGAFKIVFIGRLSHEKNIGTLINAFSKLEANKYSLIIVGSGPQQEHLQELVRRNISNPEQVLFTGQLSKQKLLSTNLMNADVLVLPSLEERQGKVLMEAMACSVPVIAARAGGIPSVVKDGENGLLFNPTSSDELAALIRRINENAKLRHELIRKGHEFATEHSLDREINRLMILLEKEL